MVGDFVPGYEAVGLIGLGVPKDTPVAIVETLNNEFNSAIADPAIQRKLGELGVLAMGSNTPAEFAKYMTADAEKWAKVIKTPGFTPSEKMTGILNP
jgi:tripartite-type tricarboxylate transporter receptor subunit TctC